MAFKICVYLEYTDAHSEAVIAVKKVSISIISRNFYLLCVCSR